jgi:glycosyltransferase involved in cell wall biosynthesis
MEKISFNIVANAVLGYEGLSGGDNIFINFAKHLAKKGLKVNIFTWKHGFLMCQKNGLTEKEVNFSLSEAGRFEKWPFVALYLMRTILGILKVREIIKKGNFKGKKVIIYSSSDFYPDSLSAFFFKRWLPEAKWVAGFFLFAPNPFCGFGGKFQLKNYLFWLSQKPIFWLISKYADLIFITSEPDVVPFVKAGRKPKDLVVVKGGIDYQHLKKFQEPAKKIYDAVFIGRFHPQKGVMEMIDIWDEVVKKKPKAKLAVIGLGEMEDEMRRKIREYKLEENVNFLGVMIDDHRNKVLQQSRVILHPAVYDSGGMAAASGLACGLPGVCFDLPVFKTYYSQGFLRARISNIHDFAKKIITLLEDKDLYNEMSKEAVEEAISWDWDKRVKNIYKKFINNEE